LNEREILLKKIQAEDFAVYETVLFLDAYPNDKAALSFYNSHRDNVEKLKKEYMEKYGPLTIYENCGGDCWHWIDRPWPWEKEAN
jgi:spore coat protein JB